MTQTELALAVAFWSPTVIWVLASSINAVRSFRPTPKSWRLDLSTAQGDGADPSAGSRLLLLEDVTVNFSGVPADLDAIEDTEIEMAPDGRSWAQNTRNATVVLGSNGRRPLFVRRSL